MNKIFKYELQRLIFSKFFIGLLIINGIYAWFILSIDIIAGVACTAPFSQWSFSAYLAKTMPVSILTILFLLTFYYSKNEKQVEVLTTATPVNPVHYTLVRNFAVVICFLIIYLLIIGLSMIFYVLFFDFKNFASFILPAILVLLPCFAFAVGIGNLAGRIHPGLLYALMLVTLIIGFAGITGTFDFFGGGYFSSYPMSLPVGLDGEPAFTVSIGFIVARIVYFIFGVILMIINTRFIRRKMRTA